MVLSIPNESILINTLGLQEAKDSSAIENIITTLVTSHIPVILLIAKTNVTHQERGYKIGANTYITKPFNSNILEARVDNLLEFRARLTREFKKGYYSRV